MKDSENVMLIPKIKLGIVIDHIPAGDGIKVLEIITRHEEMHEVVVSLGQNYKSKKLGRKDLIKLQMDYLSPEIIQHISLVVPGVTIKAVKNYDVHSKVVAHPPKEIKNLLVCKNPNCVTNLESHIESYFTAVDKEIKTVKCYYCERVFELHALEPNVD
ncbi:MAG: aspartate carbamoyltransferase regulatory subunit [Caldithrix sp.]|nr:aspartate carbamoyltransferase regulatory subunit [Caldithrix sp.]